MEKTYKESINMWAVGTDAGHILHRKGSEEYPEVRHTYVTDPDEYEEVSADMPRVVEARKAKTAEIDAYDTSEAVNSFTLDSQTMWLAKADRVGLSNSIAIEEAAGRTVTALWSGGTEYHIPIVAARRMLAALELYALDCFNVTARHKAAVASLDTVEAVETYDHTAGYPARPEFSTKA